jgi:hypothetical protein
VQVAVNPAMAPTGARKTRGQITGWAVTDATTVKTTGRWRPVASLKAAKDAVEQRRNSEARKKTEATTSATVGGFQAAPPGPIGFSPPMPGGILGKRLKKKAAQAGGLT